MYKFYVDKIAKNAVGFSKPHPNCAMVSAEPYTPEWRQFSTRWPYSEPVMLFEYMDHWDISYQLVELEDTDNDTFYPIALSFFSFDVDWFTLIPLDVFERICNQKLRILFYYSEGDNPERINTRINELCDDYYVPREQVYFASANSACRDIPYFFHVVDDELLFNFRNREIEPVEYHERVRGKKFTALVRMHKYWRANTMARIWEHGNYQQGFFGYSSEVTADETEDDNPIEVDQFTGLRELTRLFLKELPFVADDLSVVRHNNHTLAYPDHYKCSYLNIVLESHMDVDQSYGAFLTEKTFKPIKNAQPFIIFGGPSSLRLLRRLGYRTFEGIINNSYDDITNTTNRWDAAINLTLDLISLNNKQLREVYVACKSDILHNQELFLSNKKDRILTLLKAIHG